MKMLTKDRKFEVDVISLDGRQQMRLRWLTPGPYSAPHPHTWLGNFTDPETMFALIRYHGGDPATLEEVDEDDRAKRHLSVAA
jgi:hypothetical protein